MTEASQTLNPQTSTDTHNVTFSQGLAVGLTHYDWLDGKTIDPVGRDLALVSHSASPGRVRDSQTLDTCGPLFAGSSLSADPQRSLENRLRVRMEGFGSPEYVLTWKHWDIGSEPPICALRASGRRTSGKDFGGWPTTRRTDGEKGTRTNEGAYRERMRRKNGYDLPSAVDLAGWPTASSRDWKDTPGMSETGTNPDGTIRKRLDQLPRVVALTGPSQSGGPAGMESIEEFLPEEWEIPENGKLNPRFSLWLMGYPIEWASCGERVTR